MSAKKKTKEVMIMQDLIPKHGGYRNLKSFRFARLVYDITVRFCERYIDRFSRSRDQMVQAARSGVQNIAEGSSATSKKTELKLTQVARASLEELKLDYKDFLRQNNLPEWQNADPRWKELIDCKCKTADGSWELSSTVIKKILFRNDGYLIGVNLELINKTNDNIEQIKDHIIHS